MPPLRERPTDIPLLAMHFLKRFAGDCQNAITGFDAEALERLIRYEWPGNVRELEDAIERAVVVSSGDHIRAQDLTPAIAPPERPSGTPPIPGATLAHLERYAILKTLEHTGGSTSKAAELLRISPRKIQYKLHEYREAGGIGPTNSGRRPTDADRGLDK